MNSRRKEKLKNLLDQNEGIAIAITGAWGVGKTHFWSEFIDKYEVKEGYKYAYVSAFGVESIVDLKALIFERCEGGNQKNSPIGKGVGLLKKGINVISKDFKTTNVNGFVFGVSFLLSLWFGSVSNIIVCIDDIERKSSKLDIKEIMGLVDFLKNQRKCKVVVLLNDEKDKSGIYTEYKEKVFDDVLIIKDIADALSGLLEGELPIIKDEFLRFYSCFKIENIRFYKKALRVFKSIYQFLPDQRPQGAVKQIIQSTLVFLAITDLGKQTLDLDWNDLDIHKNRRLAIALDKEDEEKKSVKMLIKFYGENFSLTEWDALLKRFFLQENDDQLEEDFEILAKSELLNEKNISAQDELSNLVDGFYNFEIKNGFEEQLKKLAEMNFNSQGVLNSMFYVDILKKCGSELSAELKDNLMLWVENKLLTANRPIENAGHFFMFGWDGCEDVYQEIEKMIEQIKWPHYDLTDTMKFYIEHNGGSRSFDSRVISESTKEDWRKFIFEDTQEERFSVIRDIWKQSIFPEKNPEIHQWIRELMIEKRQESVAMDVAVDYMLSLLEKK